MLACLLWKTASPGVPETKRAAPATARVLFRLLFVTVSMRVAGPPHETHALGMLPYLNMADSNLGDSE